MVRPVDGAAAAEKTCKFRNGEINWVYEPTVESRRRRSKYEDEGPIGLCDQLSKVLRSVCSTSKRIRDVGTWPRVVTDLKAMASCRTIGLG